VHQTGTCAGFRLRKTGFYRKHWDWKQSMLTVGS